MMRALAIMLVLLAGNALPSLCLAAVGSTAVRKQVENSVLIKGSIDIEPDGSAAALQIDHEDKLSAAVVAFVRDNARRWVFEPVLRDGVAIKARAPVSLRLVATRRDDESYVMSLRGVSFERYDANDPEGIAGIRRTPPEYPAAAYQVGASGTVYLVVKVGRDGKVEDAVAEQVNLRVVGREQQMRQLREVLARSSLAAARRWSFRVPSQGPSADAPYWSVRVPISYRFDDQPDEGLEKDYGRWIGYVPGPRERVPWLTGEEHSTGFAPDALAEGGVYLAGSSRGPRLLTPLQGG